MRPISFLTAFGYVLLSCAPSSAQTVSPLIKNVNEHLAIAQKTITQSNYATSLDVELGPPVPVLVGASLSADRIVILLTGINGDLRFHGDLSRLESIIQSHRHLMPPPVR